MIDGPMRETIAASALVRISHLLPYLRLSKASSATRYPDHAKHKRPSQRDADDPAGVTNPYGCQWTTVCCIAQSAAAARVDTLTLPSMCWIW